MTIEDPAFGAAGARPVGGIVDVQLDPPDGLIIVCDGGPGGSPTRLRFELGALPAFLLQLQCAGERAVEQLGAPPRQPFLSISRLEVLRTEGILALVLHLGRTRVPLQLSDHAAHELAAALTRCSLPGSGGDGEENDDPPSVLN